MLYSLLFNINHSSILPLMALTSLYCADCWCAVKQLLTHWRIMESSSWRGVSWGDCGTQPEMVPMWRGAANRSKHGQRRPGKLDRRWLTAAYGGQSAMVTRQLSSSPTEAAWEGTAGCQRGLSFRNSAASGRETSPVTGERIEERADECYVAASGGGTCPQLTENETLYSSFNSNP